MLKCLCFLINFSSRVNLGIFQFKKLNRFAKSNIVKCSFLVNFDFLHFTNIKGKMNFLKYILIVENIFKKMKRRIQLIFLFSSVNVTNLWPFVFTVYRPPFSVHRSAFIFHSTAFIVHRSTFFQIVYK
jgi:hypothetical protein